jgi:hypothetical protein
LKHAKIKKEIKQSEAASQGQRRGVPYLVFFRSEAPIRTAGTELPCAPDGPRMGIPTPDAVLRRMRMNSKGLSGTKTSAFDAMRWLMIGLLVSLAAMLVAVAGVARHIRLERARLQSNPDAGSVRDAASSAVFSPAEEIDREK